jgi:serine/threonine protein phosphatase PrpC
VVLCSDGLTNHMRAAEFANVLCAHPWPEKVQAR